MPNHTERVALLIDLENLVISYQNLANAPIAWDKILTVAKQHGTPFVRRAYADWSRHGHHQTTLLNLGIQPVHVAAPRSKNAADLRLVIDAINLLHEEPRPTCYLLVTGDGDFTELVHHLRERGSRVVGLGLRATSASHLVAACDEFVFYEDLVRLPPTPASTPPEGEQPGEDRLQHYLDIIRQQTKIRMGPSPHRPEVILHYFKILNQNPGLSLSTLRDEVAAWFREHRPEVLPPLIHEVAHQLFHTYCFEFDEPPEGEEIPLWDRPVRFRPGIKRAGDLLDHCDLGILRGLARGLGGVELIDNATAALVLYGDAENPHLQARIERLKAQLSQGEPPR